MNSPASYQAPPRKSLRTPALVNACQSRSALLGAILLVAGAAIVLADIAEGQLETIKVLHRGGGRLRIFAKLDEPGLEVGHIFPDLGCGAEIVSFRGIRLRLGAESGNSAGIFAAASSNVAKILWTAAMSNGLSPLIMAAPIFLVTIGLHDGLARFIGSSWAMATDTPIAIAVTVATASTPRIMWQSPLSVGGRRSGNLRHLYTDRTEEVLLADLQATMAQKVDKAAVRWK